MMFTQKNLMTVCCAAVLAFGLAACGSSSDDDNVAVTTPMMDGDGDAMDGDGDGDAMDGDGDAVNGDGDAKTPAEILADARTARAALPADATDEAKETAQGLVDMALRLPGNEAELIASLDAKVEQAEERQSALDLTEQERQANAGELQNAEDALASASAEDKEAAQAAVDEALQMPGNEAALIASLEQQITDQEQTVADAAAKAALADRMAREIKVKAAIETNRVGDGTSTLAVPTGIESADLVVKRDPAGKLTVDVNGATTDDVYAGGETTAGSGAWNSVTLTKTAAGSGTIDTVVFYTDIAAPADTKFNKVYELDVRNNILNEAGRLEKAQSESFPTGATESKSFGAESGNPASFGGMFDGVLGTYECISQTGCTLTTNAKGGLTISPMWTFSANSNLVTVKVPDTSYTYFGWWLNKPKLNTADHDVEVFAGGTATTANATILMVGDANYSGPAAGKYVTRTFTAGPQTDAGVGHFTATANLTAKFGLATGEPGTIGGSVSGFELDDGTSPVWTVKLEDANLSDNTATFAGMSEVNFGGGLTAVEDTPAGTWQGSFYDDDTADTAKGPRTVVGRFDAVTDNASVIGAFGAKRQ